MLVSQLSTPLYRKAITQAVGKYNASDTPAVLEKVRGPNPSPSPSPSPEPEPEPEAGPEPEPEP